MLALAGSLAVAACGADPSPAGVTPLASGLTQPTLPPGASITISGTVWLHGANGAVPAGSHVVWGYVFERGGGRRTGAIPVDDRGSFSLTVARTVERVSITTSIRSQVCATMVYPQRQPALVTEVTADVHAVVDAEQLGGHLPASLLALGPTLSGVVYEDTPAGRLPVPDAGVVLDSLSGLGLVIADTGTDADGRYVLCGVPDVPGLTLQVSASGYQPAELAVTGASTLDVSLRR